MKLDNGVVKLHNVGMSNLAPVTRNGHNLTAWNCDEPYDGPTTREQTCPHQDCQR